MYSVKKEKLKKTMANNKLAYEFLNIMRSQMNHYCSYLNYYTFGDHAVAQMLNSKIFNLNFYVEVPRHIDIQDYEHFLQQLPHTTIDIFKLFYPDIVISLKNNYGFHKSFEFYGRHTEPLFCFNYIFDSYMMAIPYFRHELLAQDKYGNVVLLDINEYPQRQDTIFNLLKSINDKKLLCHCSYENGGRKLAHSAIVHYLRSVQSKLDDSWRIFDRVHQTYQNECVICFESMHKNTLIGLNCNHYFHIDCFKQYIENDHETIHTDRASGERIKASHKCPMCKQDITKLKIKYYINSTNEQKPILQPLQKHAEDSGRDR